MRGGSVLELCGPGGSWIFVGQVGQGGQVVDFGKNYCGAGRGAFRFLLRICKISNNFQATVVSNSSLDTN